MSKRLLIALSILLALLLGAFFLVGNYFYAFALKPRRNERAPGVPAQETAGTSESAASIANREWFDANTEDITMQSHDGLTLNTEDITMQSHDGLTLNAHLAANAGDRYAIVVHGYTGTGRSMSGFGRAFFDRGFSVLMPDCRGHGLSEGSYIGMGWHDRLDVIGWINRIIELNPAAEIILFGISMGGATVMMTSGEALPPQVKLVIEDCGYSSVWDEFSTQLREQFDLPPFPVLYAASTMSKLRAGYWFSEADAVKQVAKCALPMLFIHGEDDTFVPFAMLEPLYEAKPGIKERLVVPGAGHGAAASVDPEEYWATIDAFLEAYL